MRKIKVINTIIIFILLFTSTIVLADEAKFELEMQPDITELKRGDILNLKIVIKNDNTGTGIQGVEAKFNYDPEIFEIQKNNSSLDAYIEAGKFEVEVRGNAIYINSTYLDCMDKNDAIATIPLKIKDEAKLGKTEISISEIAGGYASMENADWVYYTGACENIEVNITEENQDDDAKLDNIAILKEPDKINYKIGEKFNPEGVKVQAIYSDGSTSDITEYTYEPTGELTEENEKIIIKYKEGNVTKQTTISISVYNPQLIVEVTKLGNITVSKNPNKIEYIEGEKFDPSGMEITALYTDGTSKKITNYVFEPNNELNVNNKEIKIKYTEENIKKECTIPIKVKVKQNNEDNKNTDNNDKKTNESQGSNEGQKNAENQEMNDNQKVDNNNTNNVDKKTNENQDTKDIKKASDISKTKEDIIDKTESKDEKLPQTGIGIIYYVPIIVIIGLCVFSMVCYRKYKIK